MKKHVAPASGRSSDRDRSSSIAVHRHPTLAAAQPAATDDTEALIQQGWAAIEDYDFDAAREAFTQALARPPGPGGGVAAARGLLTLLVDHLAQDSEALAQAPHLSSEAQADPEVAVLLALAAARSGQADAVARLLAGSRHPRAAEVLLALARGALQAGEMAAAARHLEEARAQDAGHPDLHLLDDQLRQRRAAQRAPLEEEAALYLELGEHSEAERRAQEVLTRWPESGAAKHVLRVIQEARREASARQLLRLADEAAEGGDLAAAHRSLEEAASTGVRGDLRATLLQRRDDIAALRKARAEAAQVAEIVGLLGAADLTPGLLAYAALRGPQRQRVLEQVALGSRQSARDQVALQHLRWLDELGVDRVLGHEAAAVAALTALSAAMQQVSDGPEQALTTLAAHEKLLLHLGAGRRTQREAQRLLLVQRQERARGLLRQAEAALGEEDQAAAQALLDRSGWQVLPAAEQAAAETLQKRLQRAGEIGLLREALSRHQAAEAWLAARRVAEQLIASTEAEVREHFTAERLRLLPLIQRAFAVQITTEPPAEDDPRGQRELQDVDLWPTVYHENRGQLLLPGGQQMVWVTCRGRWLFIRLLDCQTVAPVCRVLLRTPEALELECTVVDERSLWLLGERGAVLRLSLPDFAILHFQPRAELVSEDEVLEDMELTPDSRYLWLNARPRTGKWVAGTGRVIDLERRRVIREIVGLQGMFPLPGHDEPLMVARKASGDLALHSASGSSVARIRIPDVDYIYSLAMAPDGAGLLTTSADEYGEVDEDTDSLMPLRVIALSAAGAPSTPLLLSGSDGEGGHALATARAAGLSFLRFRNANGGAELLALRMEEGRLIELYRVPAPLGLLLLQDPRARQVLGLWRGDGGLRSVVLGAEPPTFDDIQAGSPLHLHALMYTEMCSGYRSSERDEGYTLARELEQQAPAARAKIIHEHQRRFEDDPGRLVAMVHALFYSSDFVAWREMARWVQQRHPSHPQVRFLSATRAADEQRWEDVHELLAAVPEDRWRAFGGATAQHAAHLLAIAALRAERYDEARRHLAWGRQITDGKCDLAGLQFLCDPGAAEATTREVLPLLRLTDALRQADACLEGGDAAGARQLLARDFVWQANEVQSLARLAEATLREADEGGAARFHKALVLASFCAAREAKNPEDLPIPERWDKARLDQLAARANHWLDALVTP